MKNSTSPQTERAAGAEVVALIGLAEPLVARLETLLMARGWRVRRQSRWRAEDADPVALIVAFTPAATTLAAKVRRSTAAPLLLLTPSGATERAAALEVGADVCFTHTEPEVVVVAQIVALLRDVRRQGDDPPPDDGIEVGRLRIDVAARTASVNDSALALAPREFDVLAHFARHPGRAFRRHELLSAVWGARFVGSPSTVDVHVAWLRQKLTAESGVRITTLRGIGYRLDVMT